MCGAALARRARAIHHVQHAAARQQHALSPLNDAERGGLGLQAALGRAVAALTGAPRAACMEDARHDGQHDAGQAAALCTPSNPNPNCKALYRVVSFLSGTRCLAEL